MSLTETANGTVGMTFTLGDITLIPDKSNYLSVDAADMVSQARHEGLPSLPQMSRLLLLPRGASVQLTACHAAREEVLPLVEGRLPQPFGGPRLKDAVPASVSPDVDVYGGKEVYRGGDLVEVEDLGTMGNRQVVRLTVHPVAYDPAAARLLLTSSITATFAVNTAKLLTSESPRQERMLVVARSQFREGLQPFVRWKRQAGYEVEELYVTTNKRDSIKMQIVNCFPSDYPERWPRYLLLVGDVAQIQAFPGTTHPGGTESHVTDLYYAEHTGDYLPDALVGRWPVNDTAQLGAVVRKTMNYEQFRDIDTAQLLRLLLVAGAEDQGPAPVTTNGQVNYVGREVALTHHELDTLCYHNPASAAQRADILGNLGQGAAMLNYTAHCTAAGWSSPSVSFSSIDTLNLTQPMLWVNNCCLSNAFDGTCFGEQLLRRPQGGAIGVIGATNSTLWNEDYYWAVGPKYPFSLSPAYDGSRLGAFDCWLGRADGVGTQGELLMAGNLSVTAFGSPYDRFYWEIYCLLGDPSLMPLVGVPQMPELTLYDTLRVGDNEVRLHTTAGVSVSLMQADSLLGMAIAEESGEVVIRLRSSIDTGEVLLTCADHAANIHNTTRPFQLRPRFDTLRAAAPAVTVGFYDVNVTDGAVTFRLANLGADTLPPITLGLVQDSDELALGATVTAQYHTTSILPPQASVDVSLPYMVTVVGQSPLWRARLTASIDTVVASLTLQHATHTAYPAATFRLLEAGGDEAHSLLPLHEYAFETTVDGSADNIAIFVTALPSGDTMVDACVSLQSSTYSFSTPDTLTHLHIEATLALGNHRTVYSYFLVGGHRRDNFEEGFASYPWQQGGGEPWTIDDATARSGAIVGRQTSNLGVDVLLHQADSVSFWVKTSSESRYDKFQFLVDGVRQGNELWGETSWRRYAVPLAAGRHTLLWRYVKDDSGDVGSDCVWLDNVRMPLVLWDSAYGWFGSVEAGIAPTDEVGHLRLFPNPTSGTVYVDGVAQGSLSLLDLYGRTVLTSSITPHTMLNLSHLPDGVYLLQVTTVTGRYHHKIIIHH